MSLCGRSEMEECRPVPYLPEARPHFLDPELRGLVREMDGFTPVSVPYESTVIREGDEADALYLLSDGRARVVRRDGNGQEMTLTLLQPGNLFGEIGLLQGGKRTATVRACDRISALRLDRSRFHEVLRRQPEVLGYLKRHIQRLALQDFLLLQSPFSETPLEVLATMIKELQSTSVTQGQVVIRQGDNPGPLYIVQEGMFRVCVEKDGYPDYTSDLGVGDVFGELAILRGVRRTARVEALSAGKLLSLCPRTCWRLVNEFPAFKWQMETIMCWHGWVPP